MNTKVRGELIEPIIATVRARSVGGVDGRAAVWDPVARRWQDNTTGGDFIVTSSHRTLDLLKYFFMVNFYVRLL